MRFVALVSGGKDSIYSILECIKNGHELIACVHLGAPVANNNEGEGDDELEESYMYQTAASEVVRTLVEDCLQVPLLLYTRVGTSVNTSLVYDHQEDHVTSSSEKKAKHDEVEDLYEALRQAQEQYHVSAVCSGAILSTYQRVRIEHVCTRLGLTSLSYLWRLEPQKELLQRMLRDGIVAVVVRVACPPGLKPRLHLNKTLRYLWDTGLLERLHERYQFHVCGEGGEYESLVIDSPLHKKKLVFDQVKIDEADDGCGNLLIPQCHAEEKGPDDVPVMDHDVTAVHTFLATTMQETVGAAQNAQDVVSTQPAPMITHLPTIRHGSGGLLHIGEIMVSSPALDPSRTEAELAVVEALQVFASLRRSLEAHSASAQDVVFVHLYLSEISHFGSINTHYQDFFGSLLPPSRSCVAVGERLLPGGRRVLLDCMVQVGSGDYLRSNASTSASLECSPYAKAACANKSSKLRDVLHVQSISHWAPICVGPYSQVNTVRSGLHFLAGQIGMIPAQMKLHSSWPLQLEQCWRNVACVLDALDGSSLDDLFSAMIYVSCNVFRELHVVDKIRQISHRLISENGHVAPGKIDMLSKYTQRYGGYEDEGTWNEMRSQEEDASIQQTRCPILIVSIPEMPKSAAVEVEVVTIAENASSNLLKRDATVSMQSATASRETSSLGWDTGHTLTCDTEHTKPDIDIEAYARVLGKKCASSVLVTASTRSQSDCLVDTDRVINDMLVSASKVLAEGRAGMMFEQLLHVRLYYLATTSIPDGESSRALDDGIQVRVALKGAIENWTGISTLGVSATTVPVHGIRLLNATSDVTHMEVVVAMQIMFYDPVHTETEIWIRKDREYAT